MRSIAWGGYIFSWHFGQAKYSSAATVYFFPLKFPVQSAFTLRIAELPQDGQTVIENFSFFIFFIIVLFWQKPKNNNDPRLLHEPIFPLNIPRPHLNSLTESHIDIQTASNDGDCATVGACRLPPR